MKKLLFLFVLTSIVSKSFSQKKDIENQLLITNKTPQNFLQALPSVNKWLDAERVQVFMKPSENETMKNVVLNLKTGKI